MLKLQYVKQFQFETSSDQGKCAVIVVGVRMQCLTSVLMLILCTGVPFKSLCEIMA